MSEVAEVEVEFDEDAFFIEPPSSLPTPVIAGALGGAALLGIVLGALVPVFVPLRRTPPTAAAPAVAAAVEPEPIPEIATREVAPQQVGSFLVNLRGTGGARTAHVEVWVELSNLPMRGEKGMEDDPLLPDLTPLKDVVVRTLSDYTPGELEGLDGKTRVRDELHARMQGALRLGRGTPEDEERPGFQRAYQAVRVDRVYFTDFLVQ